MSTTEKVIAHGRTAAIATDERLEAAGILQKLLTDAIDLALQAKHAHWNLHGIQFRSIHHQLDEVAETARQFSDRMAERCLALGAAADGRVASIAANTSLDPSPEGRIEDTRVVEHMVERLHAVSEVGRSRLQRLERADPVSQNLVCEFLEQIEKQLWMFESSRSNKAPNR